MTSLVQYNTESLRTADLSKMKKLADAFIADQRVAETSRKTYRWGIMLFFKWVLSNGLMMDAITLADINLYEDYLRKKRYADRTVRAYITVIKIFYEWTERNGLYPNIAQYIKVRGNNKKFSRQHLTSEQGRMLLSAAKEGPQSLRNFAILNLILYTGLRTIEVRRAKIEDIDYYMGQRILRVRGKGKGENNTEDFVVLIDDAYLPIKEYLGTERKDCLKGEPLFTTNGNKSSGCPQGRSRRYARRTFGKSTLTPIPSPPTASDIRPQCSCSITEPTCTTSRGCSAMPQ